MQLFGSNEVGAPLTLFLCSSPLGMPKGRCTFPLSSLALTRSGDKGNNVNIGKVYIPIAPTRLILPQH